MKVEMLGPPCGLIGDRPTHWVDQSTYTAVRGQRDALLTYVHDNMHQPRVPMHACGLCAMLREDIGIS